MAEKIKHQKTENEIREDIIELKVRHYKVDDANGTESKLITKCFGVETENLKSKVIPFFYSEFLDMNNTLVKDFNNEKIINYFGTLKQDLRYAFDIFDVLQRYEDFIDNLKTL